MTGTNDAREVARQVAEFLATDFGTQFIGVLSGKYNDLHHEAESEQLTPAQKGMKVERAAGVKWVIDYLVERDRLLKEGYFDEKIV